MKEISRWSWIKVVGNTKLEFNSKDFLNSKKFWLMDNETFRVFCLQPILDSNNKPNYVYIPNELQNQEFINWTVSTSYDLLEYLPKKFLTPETIKTALQTTKELEPTERDRIFNNITFEQWILTIKLYPDILKLIPSVYQKLGLINENNLDDDNTKRLEYTVNLIKSESKNTKTKSKINKNTKLKKTKKEQPINNNNNILLENIPGFFGDQKMKQILNALEIFTLEDFFIGSTNPNFINIFRNSQIMYREINATIRLLRCKYLKENPLIELDPNMTLEEIIKKLGLSLDVEVGLIEMGFNYSQRGFLTDMANVSLEKRIKFFRKNSNMSNEEIEELVYRIQIIIDYYNCTILEENNNLNTLRSTVNLLSKVRNKENT